MSKVSSIVREDAARIVDCMGETLRPLEGSTFLITGACGFLGSFLLDTMAEFNRRAKIPCHVIAVDNFKSGLPTRVEHLQNERGFSFVTHDVSKPIPVSEPVHYIFHGASVASPTFYRQYPLETIDVNVNGTKHLLERTRRGDVRSMLFMSTSEIYGDPTPDAIPTKEDYRGFVSCTGPRACYDESKRLGETLCANYFRQYGTPVKVIRPFNVYGPGQRLDDLRIIPDLMTSALAGGPLVLLSDGRAKRAFCYVRDFIWANLEIMLRGENGEAYNVGNDEEELSMLEVAERMADAVTPRPSIQYQKSADVHYLTDNPQRRCANLTKLRTLLSHWSPEVSLREGLKRTFDSHREVGDSWKAGPTKQKGPAADGLRVTIFGAGYVGLVTGACLASIGHDVTCVDVDPQRVADINSGKSPIYEEGLDAMLTDTLERGVFRATLSASDALKGSDIAMIAVGTPPKDGKIDLSYVNKVAETIGEYLKTANKRLTVVVKSTVVPGTTMGNVRQALERASGRKAGADFGLAMNPEFLREGTAIEDFMVPDRVVIGEACKASGDVVAKLYARFSCPVMRVNPTNAEFVKYASNTLLATLVSFSNELYRMCESTAGADGETVMDGLAMDKRLSPIVDGVPVKPGILTYLRGGIGYGGSCLPKDISALRMHAETIQLPMPLLNAVSNVNDERPNAILAIMERELGGSIQGKTVAVLGVAFKPGTDDIRASPALPMIEGLLARGAKVRVTDPQALSSAKSHFGSRVTFAESAADTLDGADCALLATSWPEFSAWDWQKLAPSMKQPLLVDGRNALRAANGAGRLNGVRYVPVGRG
jgi:nucleotide sugar dehydrogenase